MALTLIFVAVAIFLVGTSAGVVVLTSLASLREDHDLSMAGPAQTRLAQGARVLTGLYVRTPASLYVRTLASVGPSPSQAAAPGSARQPGTGAGDGAPAGQPGYATLQTVRLTWPVA
jgi:hypothetical protein